MQFTNHQAELLRLIRLLAPKYSTWSVFEDFLAMSAYTFSNSVDAVHRDEREADYMKIAGKYKKEELTLFPEMLYHLIEELECYTDSPTDVLGRIFHELELHNKYKGQFFTPQSICDMMGEMVLGANDSSIAERGYITVAEPSVGSGAMILGFAKAMTNNHFNYQKQMVVMAIDIDIKCVWMAYLQFTLYNIPAVVIHGNSLSMQEWSRWYTPAYILDGWVWRDPMTLTTDRNRDDEMLKMTTGSMYAAIRRMDGWFTEAPSDENN